MMRGVHAMVSNRPSQKQEKREKKVVRVEEKNPIFIV